MKTFFSVLINALLLSACSVHESTNIHNTDLVFTDIKSDFIVKDINDYDCDKIDITTLNHVFSTANPTTHMDAHDNFSTVGCSIEGSVTTENEYIGFKLDYGGIIYLDNGEIMVCGEECCQNDFEYCTWEKHE